MSFLSAHKNWGISTGWEPTTRADFPVSVANAAMCSQAAVELSALSTRDVTALLRFLKNKNGREQLRQFTYVSAHGPAKDLPSDERKLAAMLARILGGINHIVMHPETLRDLGLFTDLGARLVLENADVRKHDCRTAAEIQRVFAALPQARFCLDVAHAWTVDPTLRVAHELVDAYDDRLVEVHVSGIHISGKHRPTTAADLERYAPVLARCGNVPWILESPWIG